MKEHPVFAFFYDRMARAAQRWEEPYRDELCGEARGLVLELGSGTGLNFGRHRLAERVVAVEPEPNMLRRSVPRAAEPTIPICLVRGSAQALPFAEATFDTVLTSLVLCSVPDLTTAVGELRRVLKEDGVPRFYEHVRSEHPRTARWQDRLERPWGLFAGGCHPNRDSVGAMRAGGFAVELSRFDPPVPGGRFLPHVIGEARPAAGAGAG
jgi:ubiquinone/menaquinone biosynthesis C-methylase UbiE